MCFYLFGTTVKDKLISVLCFHFKNIFTEYAFCSPWERFNRKPSFSWRECGVPFLAGNCRCCCSHIAGKARLGCTSVPYCNSILALSSPSHSNSVPLCVWICLQPPGFHTKYTLSKEKQNLPVRHSLWRLITVVDSSRTGIVPARQRARENRS